jgi:branched-subunit amino acid aminotransferase/4-amino-4-deoxychorismate lyase
MYVILNKKLIKARDAKVSVNDRGFKFGDGIYETIRTIDGKPWLLLEHLRRLRQSAKLLKMKVPLTNAEFKHHIERLIKKNKYKESRIRITISRTGTVLIEATRLVRHNGSVSAITFKGERTMPLAKSTNMLTSILGREEAQKKKAYEALLVDKNGNITEGAYSNIFVVKNNQLYTPKDDILEGTTRDYIIKKYKKVRYAKIPKNKIHTYDEIFITSSTNGAIPVVKVDGRPINNGKIGRLTKQIIKLLPYGTKKSHKKNQTG